MIQLHADSRTRILEYLKSLAPFSVIDKGTQFAQSGHVTECSRSGNRVFGAVKDEGEETTSTTLNILSGSEVDAGCTCCSSEQMSEQWCHHAVALMVRACDLGFFDAHSGFDSEEAIYRMPGHSPQDIASVVRDLASLDPGRSSETVFEPEATIILDLSDDRMGIRVLFNGEDQTPVLFEGFKRISARALDNILLQSLDEHGTWDEEKQLWYVNSSQGIQLVLGILQEYPRIISGKNLETMRIAREPLQAKLRIEWQQSGACLSMFWRMPDGNCILRNTELLGTGPYWTEIGNTIYRIASSASRIAQIFNANSTFNMPRGQVGPLLEAIRAGLHNPALIEILNRELEPASEVKTPQPMIELSRRDSGSEHFSSGRQLEIQATLDFDYPVPPQGENLVYLPNHEKERENVELLKSIGFESQSDHKRFAIFGDSALELIHKGPELFPSDWKVNGFDAVRKGIRFVDLAINMTLSTVGDGEEETSKTGRIDWFDCHVSLVQNNAHVPLSIIFKNAKSDADRWVRLDGGAYAQIPGGTLSHLKTTLGVLDPNFKLSNTIRTKLSMAQAISFGRLNEENFNVNLDRKLAALARKLESFDSIDRIKAPKNFEGELRNYQEDGLSWLYFLHELGLGGVLADEMGLGKTVQTLALLQTLRGKKARDKAVNKPSLVVAPTSVITNWLYEARRFTPNLKVLLLHGPQRKQFFSQIGDYDIVITSYALLRLDRYDLEKWEFGHIILDEAQNIKNPEAATTRAAKALRARSRLALSGTPTENRPMELWSIMDFLMPGYLGSIDFFKTYVEKPIIEGGPSVQVTKFLNGKTRPFLLRRKKADVEKELPPKLESVLPVSMTDSQRQLYTQILEEVRPRVFEAVQTKGVRGASISILAALLRLRQVCNHPNSIEALKELPGLDSGKFNLLKDLIQEALESGRKILVFSQFREMLAIIKRWMEQVAINYLYLDGSTKNRQDLIDQFNNDESVRLFLISLKAGGTGLNLTAADTVIIYDPWWNPAVEHQAVDRAHRIGQTKTVQVYRLVTENSVEQKIMALKERKSSIVDALINDNSLSTLSLSKLDVESLFTIFPGDVSDSQ